MRDQGDEVYYPDLVIPPGEWDEPAHGDSTAPVHGQFEGLNVGQLAAMCTTALERVAAGGPWGLDWSDADKWQPSPAIPEVRTASARQLAIESGEWVNAEQAAERLGVSTSTVYHWVGKGRLTVERSMGRALFKRADVEAYADNRAAAKQARVPVEIDPVEDAKWVDLGEAAAILGLTRPTIQERVRKGEMVAEQIPGRKRRGFLRTYLAEGDFGRKVSGRPVGVRNGEGKRRQRRKEVSMSVTDWPVSAAATFVIPEPPPIAPPPAPVLETPAPVPAPVEASTVVDAAAAALAQSMHDTYRELAPAYDRSALPWGDLAPGERRLLIATARTLLARAAA